MGYINNNSQTNTQLTYNQHTANMQSTHDQQTDNIQVTTYKNIRNKEIKKNISSTSARAREVENFEVLDGKEEKENQQKKETKELHKDVNQQFKGFEVYFQPIIDMKTEKIHSMEALLRFECD